MPSPLLGYNTNVRHRGKLFHIQTEDSGVSHAHIFTHLFADGGRIIATKKSSYAHWISTDRYPGVVKKLMQAQHKAMFIALRDGLFDEDELAGAKAFAEREIVLEDEGPSSAEPKSDAADIDALEAAAARHAPQFDAPQPRAPGPARSPVPAPATGPAAKSEPAKPAAAKPPSQPRFPATPANVQAARSPKYQETKPAARPRAAKPTDSVFGADILSEKSLDEVIMSYLAEDLDEKE